MMKEKIVTLKDSLYLAMLYYDKEFKWYTPQSNELFWSIEEGIERMKNYEIKRIKNLNQKKKNKDVLNLFYDYLPEDSFFNLNKKTSRKIHECSICGENAIQYNDKYFHWIVGHGYTDSHKICAKCVAYALFVNKVWDLTEVNYSYWDSERKIEITNKEFENSS